MDMKEIRKKEYISPACLLFKVEHETPLNGESVGSDSEDWSAKKGFFDDEDEDDGGYLPYRGLWDEDEEDD